MWQSVSKAPSRAMEDVLHKMRIMLAISMGALLFANSAAAIEVRTAVLRIDYPQLAPITRYDDLPDDVGFAGGRLADEDNGTTGSFLGMTFETRFVAATADGAKAELTALRAGGIDIIVLIAKADDTLALVDAAGPGALLLNAGARDVRLREEDCRAQLLHITPGDDMRADAVAQFAMWKKWPRWFLIGGSNPADIALTRGFHKAFGHVDAAVRCLGDHMDRCGPVDPHGDIKEKPLLRLRELEYRRHRHRIVVDDQSHLIQQPSVRADHLGRDLRTCVILASVGGVNRDSLPGLGQRPLAVKHRGNVGPGLIGRKRRRCE